VTEDLSCDVCFSIILFVGFSITFQALKYAYYSKELYNLLITGDILPSLGPVYAQLNELGAHVRKYAVRKSCTHIT
jgi:hypothetical protein